MEKWEKKEEKEKRENGGGEGITTQKCASSPDISTLGESQGSHKDFPTLCPTPATPGKKGKKGKNGKKRIKGEKGKKG